MSQITRGFIGSGPGPFVETLTGNTGGAVGPTGNNINVIGDGTTTTVAGNPGTSTLTISVIGGSSSITITGDSGGPLTSNSFTFTGGTSGLTFAGAGSTETLGGTLNVGHGGTGANTFTSHGVLIGNTTSAVTATAAGTTGQVLTGVTGSAPTFQSPAASSITITGDSGGGLTGNSFTFTGGSTGLTFAGSGTTETLGGDLVVSNGGTGNTTFTAYSVITAGTTATGSFQNVSGLGSSGQVLTSQGAASLPHWANIPSSGVVSIAGNTGGALTGAISIVTANATPIFAGSGTTETLDFNLSNLVLGSSLPSLGSGVANTGLGKVALAALTNGSDNTAVGFGAATSVTIASDTTAVGTNALTTLVSGSDNTAIGYFSLEEATGQSNTALGSQSGRTLGSGTNNIIVGYLAATNYVGAESSNIIVGNAGVAAESNVIRLGTSGSSTGQQNKAFVAGINGITPGATALVTITDSNGQVGTISSGTSGWVLTSAGVGSNPSFQTPASSSITITGDSGGGLTGNSFTFTGGTTGLTFAGASSTETLGGDLNVGHGGTGNTTFTAYSVITAGTTATGAFQNVSGVGTSGQVLTSQGASALPQWATPSAGGTSWSVITASQAAVAGKGYICNGAGQVVLTLPASGSIGDTIEITGINNATGWQIAQNANQYINIVGSTTTVGTGGSLTSSETFDSIRIVCVVSGASTGWNAVSVTGNLTIV
jgi:hypothetical protein